MTKTKELRQNLVNNLPQLNQGDSSLAVAILQQLLILENYSANLSVTGYFGEETASAVINFQQAVGLVNDGIVGQNTWNALATY